MGDLILVNRHVRYHIELTCLRTYQYLKAVMGIQACLAEMLEPARRDPVKSLYLMAVYGGKGSCQTYLDRASCVVMGTGVIHID